MAQQSKILYSKPKRIMKNTLQHLAGKSKEEILEEMGQDFNYYPAEVWTYILHTTWLGKKTVLYLFLKIKP